MSEITPEKANFETEFFRVGRAFDSLQDLSRCTACYALVLSIDEGMHENWHARAEAVQAEQNGGQS